MLPAKDRGLEHKLLEEPRLVGAEAWARLQSERDGRSGIREQSRHHETMCSLREAFSRAIASSTSHLS
jgi:hypothetical protein